jgi:2,5-diketo-D-gluconate reductase A
MSMTVRSSQESVRLSDGVAIPLIGFGTWQLDGDDAYNGVRAALEIGYRHIDTATAYANEDKVGAAVRDSGVGRENVFITTKCPPGNAGREAETLDASLHALGVDFVDLWLVHWPPNGEARPDTWKAFVQALEQGKTRAIGVSNYSLAQIDELIDATGRAPALNQIPWNPFAFNAREVAELQRRDVVLEGYSPLKRTDLGNPVLAEIAAAHRKTAAQVVLRWHVEHGFVVIPRSQRRERIEENFAVFDFELTEEERRRLDALGA